MRKLIGFVVGAIDSVVALVGTATASRAATHQATAKKPITSGFYRGRTIGYYDFGPIKLNPREQGRTDRDRRERHRRPTQHRRHRSRPERLHTALAGEQGDVQDRRLTAPASLAQRCRSSTQARRRERRSDEHCGQLPRARLRSEASRRLLRRKDIHYYDLGPVNVATGNAVLPLVAVTTASRGSTTSLRTRSRLAQPTTRLSGRSSRQPGRVRRTRDSSHPSPRSRKPRSPVS